jgi:streptomycin 6-kinase
VPAQAASIDRYLRRWRLAPDGGPIATRSSDLMPVRRAGMPAMLKIARSAEERRGARLMAWWQGDGAARVLARDGDALLLERAPGTSSLTEMARSGQDDEATRILCAVAARLHVPREGRARPALVPLEGWFVMLARAASAEGGILGPAAAAARELLSEPRDITVLHGDIHHANVLDFGPRGWLAIDPKGLIGERGFDFANIFCNPDPRTAANPGRLTRQASIVANTARMERTRLLTWILAYAGLSAAWSMDEGDDPRPALAVAGIAAAELGRS